MSFIEKNKVWLLPLLGLGVLGVGYMNFRTIQGDAPVVAIPPEAVPEAPPVETEAPETSEAQTDLWTDLKPFAVLPGNLALESALTDRARVALGAELDNSSPLLLGRPMGAALAAPVSKPGAAGVSSSGLPELEFLIHGPHGSYAWFEGRAYQAGEKVLESGYTLSRIGPTSVELTGPRGRIVESTHAIGQNLSHPVEAP